MKVIDQTYYCEIPGQVFGFWKLHCHLQIFQPHAEVQTVMVTDMGFKMGWFIPYLIEKLIEQIVQEFHLDPNKVVWIEHYTPNLKKPTCADFSQVTFEWHEGRVVNPQWNEITLNMAKALISESLIAV